jgi:hypothetical protein
MHGIPCITTLSGAQAAVHGIEAARYHEFSVTPVQEFIKKVK